MTYANIAAIWALALCLVATGWTHEQAYQAEAAKPAYDAKAQVVTACGNFLEREMRLDKTVK
jgi:hypothetical protein